MLLHTVSAHHFHILDRKEGLDLEVGFEVVAQTTWFPCLTLRRRLDFTQALEFLLIEGKELSKYDQFQGHFDCKTTREEFRKLDLTQCLTSIFQQQLKCLENGIKQIIQRNFVIFEHNYVAHHWSCFPLYCGIFASIDLY
jgi:hypothetical protein